LTTACRYDTFSTHCRHLLNTLAEWPYKGIRGDTGAYLDGAAFALLIVDLQLWHMMWRPADAFRSTGKSNSSLSSSHLAHTLEPCPAQSLCRRGAPRQETVNSLPNIDNSIPMLCSFIKMLTLIRKYVSLENMVLLYRNMAYLHANYGDQ